jgi:hypothetical protein
MSDAYEVGYLYTGMRYLNVNSGRTWEIIAIEFDWNLIKIMVVKTAGQHDPLYKGYLSEEDYFDILNQFNLGNFIEVASSAFEIET